MADSKRSEGSKLQVLLSKDPHTIRWAAITIILFATTQFCTIMVIRYLRFPAEGFTLLFPRGIVTVIGIFLAWMIFCIQALGRPKSLLSGALLAIGLAVLGCFLHGIANEITFMIVRDSRFVPADFVANTLAWFWFYLSSSAIFLALNQGEELAENRVRLEKLRTLASMAQLSALRYQLNPHFLFNTLNSIAALIGERQMDQAERMIVRLSDFLRAGLDADPLEEVALSEELAQQRRYLEIEQIRFSNRLVHAFDIDADVENALVPSLILQPLVENAIKYGVASSVSPVTIAIEAKKVGDTVRIVVRDDGGGQQSGASGAGIGLYNVRERLASLFGAAATMTASPLAGGGYTVTLTLPLKYR